jgi:hypothetical protein
MQLLNNSATASLMQTLQSLVSKASKVLIVQQQFWGGGEVQQQGTLKRTVDAERITFEYVFNKARSSITFSWGAMHVVVFVSSDDSIPSRDNPVVYYEIVDKMVRFEMRGGNPRLKTSLTFS